MKFSATFEHSVKPSFTVRGTIEGDLTPQRVANRAINLLEKAQPKYKWESLVVVIDRGLEK